MIAADEAVSVIVKVPVRVFFDIVAVQKSLTLILL
jgi:hypothetical protein